MPYVFQIMSQLLELHDPPAPPAYQELFPHLLAPPLWEKLGVCALWRYLRPWVRISSLLPFFFGQASRAVTT
jgi:exportin-2 (importin alpha re-exporter)